MKVKEELRQFAYDNEMDYFGVTPVDRMKDLPEHYRPTDLYPEGKNVIVMGMALSEGVIQAHDAAFSGGPDRIQVFTAFGYNKVNELLNIAALRMVRLIEKKYGGIALPMPSNGPHNEEDWMGTLSNRYAAMCAGLGEMTWSGHVATPKHGPRVRWVTVLTDLELEADSFYSGERLCRYPECRICVDCCPAHAISDTECVHVNAGGYETDYAKRDKPKCRCAVKGLVKGTPGRLQNDIPHNNRMKNMEDWYQLTKKDDPWQRMEFNHGNYCLRCMTQCPIGMKEGEN